MECFIERAKEHGRWINNFLRHDTRQWWFEDVRKRITIVNKHHNGFVMQRRKRMIELQSNTTQIFTKFLFVQRDKRFIDSSDKREKEEKWTSLGYEKERRWNYGLDRNIPPRLARARLSYVSLPVPTIPSRWSVARRRGKNAIRGGVVGAEDRGTTRTRQIPRETPA